MTPSPEPRAEKTHSAYTYEPVYCKSGCGEIGWTVKAMGKLLHKCACPERLAPYCQSHPRRCPS